MSPGLKTTLIILGIAALIGAALLAYPFVLEHSGESAVKIGMALLVGLLAGISSRMASKKK